MEWHVHLIDSVRICTGAASIPVRPPKQRLLLAAFGWAERPAVGVDALSAALWPGDPPKTAANALQVHVSALRALIRSTTGILDPITFDGHTYRINWQAEASDVGRIRRTFRSKNAIGALDANDSESVDAWQGAFLAIGDDPFANVPEGAVRDKLHIEFAQYRRRALLALAQVQHEGVGRDTLAQLLHNELSANAFDDEIRAALMWELYRAGRQRDAMMLFREGRTLARQELGVDPTPILVQMYARIIEGKAAHSANQDRRAPQRGDTRLATVDLARFPQYRNGFFGRRSEIEECAAFTLSEYRWATVLGPAGMGKTRLICEFARRLPTGYRPTVAFVSLAPLTSESQVLPAIATELGYGASESWEELALALANEPPDTQHLLLLDNFECVSDSAPAILDFIKACPSMKIMVTSQRAPHIGPQFIVRLGALPNSVALFVDRVTHAGDHVPDADLKDVEEICHILGDVPLAVELAAGRYGVLSARNLRQRLLSHALDVLQSDGSSRHASVANALKWSFMQLSDDEHAAMLALSVFRDSFAVTDVERVISLTSPLNVLNSLKELGLLIAVNGEMRLLFTVREFALELLRDDTERELAVRMQHLLLCQSTLAQVAALGGEGNVKSAAALFESRRYDLEAAFEFAADSPSPEAGQYVLLMLNACADAGRLDIFQTWLAPLHERLIAPAHRAELERVLGWYHIHKVIDWNAAYRHSLNSLLIFEYLGPAGCGRAVLQRYNLASLCTLLGRPEAALSFARRIADWPLIRPDVHVAAHGIMAQAWAMLDHGPEALDEARTYFRLAPTLDSSDDDEYFSMLSLAPIEFCYGDRERAGALYLELEQRLAGQYWEAQLEAGLRLAAWHLCLPDLDAMEKHIVKVRDLAREYDCLSYDVPLLYLESLALLARHDVAGAQRSRRRADRAKHMSGIAIADPLLRRHLHLAPP